MALKLANLDDETRQLMIAEIKLDDESGKLYQSDNLDGPGRRDWEDLLETAAEKHNEVWLAEELLKGGRLLKSTSRGKVPSNAATKLADGEFNRFYMRALCLRAKGGKLTIYRAKEIERPRAGSQNKIGTSVSADLLLNSLRARPGSDTARKMSWVAPNSGLSVKLQ